MTVREWMENDEILRMDLMTGSGYIQLERADFQTVLHGGTVRAHLGCKENEHEISPEDFIDEEVTSDYVRDGVLYGIA